MNYYNLNACMQDTYFIPPNIKLIPTKLILTGGGASFYIKLFILGCKIIARFKVLNKMFLLSIIVSCSYLIYLLPRTPVHILLLFFFF